MPIYGSMQADSEDNKITIQTIIKVLCLPSIKGLERVYNTM